MSLHAAMDFRVWFCILVHDIVQPATALQGMATEYVCQLQPASTSTLYVWALPTPPSPSKSRSQHDAWQQYTWCVLLVYGMEATFTHRQDQQHRAAWQLTGCPLEALFSQLSMHISQGTPSAASTISHLGCTAGNSQSESSSSALSVHSSQT